MTNFVDEFRERLDLNRRKAGLAIIAATVVIIALLLAIFRAWLPQGFNLRTILVLAGALAVLAAADMAIVSRPTEDVPVRYILAFNAVILIVVGITAGVLMCSNWEIAILLAGTCLLIGGFIGLLFGYPQGVAQQQQAVAMKKTEIAAAQQSSSSVGQAAPAVAAAQVASVTHSQNLLAESAATLGKVITGFTLAKYSSFAERYRFLSWSVGQALGYQDPHTSTILAGLLMAYFLATGFLAGLILPPYFMADFLGDSNQ